MTRLLPLWRGSYVLNIKFARGPRVWLFDRTLPVGRGLHRCLTSWISKGISRYLVGAFSGMPICGSVSFDGRSSWVMGYDHGSC